MLITKTYQTTTPSSREHGDYHEQGFIYKDAPFTVDEAVHMLNCQHALIWSVSPINHITYKANAYCTSVEPDMDIKTDTHMYYSFHFTYENEEEFTQFMDTCQQQCVIYT